ncbi:hypothetical protein H8L32_11495 [Undibacterium sp. CY18W]|uniref:Uncharacterized protein n=1 Tax=Undibacterium hunanense TaxID=2762292 RepID=A0ABR6ZQG1_9BURK|nr:hypothetical protein [Undibacterium hunanense]MBC3918103.1 hypothetical protein [Undibacterium hunanense]
MLAKFVQDNRYLFDQNNNLNPTGRVTINFSASNGMAQLQLVVCDSNKKTLISVGTPVDALSVLSTAATGTASYSFDPPAACSPDGYVSWNIFITSNVAGSTVDVVTSVSQAGRAPLHDANVKTTLSANDVAAHVGYDGLYFN